jgi:hypothetical protein
LHRLGVSDIFLIDIDLVLLVVVALVEADAGDKRVEERVQELCTEVVFIGVLVE